MLACTEKMSCGYRSRVRSAAGMRSSGGSRPGKMRPKVAAIGSFGSTRWKVVVP